MLKVAAYTGGVNDPAARFRVRQYISALAQSGIELVEFVSKLGCHPPRNRLFRPLWGIGTLAERMTDIVRAYRYDLTLLQRTMLSTYLTMEPLTNRPRLLDVDDAIWLHKKDSDFAKRLAGLCDVIICGNAFLADQFRQWNANVTIIPTAVDTDRYHPLVSDDSFEKKVIGWSGSSSGFRYLYSIERPLAVVLKKHPTAFLRIVADTMPRFNLIPLEQLEFIRWTPEVEVSSIQEMNIGLMPLDDSLWSRGKCSFKMLTYMACGVPVVASPIGMNYNVLSLGKIGFGPTDEDAWVATIGTLLECRETAIQMGKTGRKIVLDNFSTKIIAPRLAECIKQVANL